MGVKNSAVAICNTHIKAKQVVKRLNKSGIDMEKLYIVNGLEDSSAIEEPTSFNSVLSGFGIPRNSILKYEIAIKADKYLVIAHGSRGEVEKAKEIIESCDIFNVTMHHA